ncbi:MAG TPA: hypothetical protein VH702_16690 [Vicinamibacterales bacterium]|jgi:hypothetical protein
MTSDAARAMGVERETGTIGEGKYADVIAVRGDPFRHIDVLRRGPAMLVFGGILVFVMFGQLVADPMFVATSAILPRTGLLIALLFLPAAADRYSIDVARRSHRIRGRQAARADHAG